MGFEPECKKDNPTPKTPEGGATAQCRNCAQMILDGETDESMSYKWKELKNYPDDLSCPDCGEAEIHPDPRDPKHDRSCQFSDERHEMFCCRCGTWMYRVPNVDVSGWKCPNEKCSVRKLG